jgi:hypothetical protein
MPTTARRTIGWSLAAVATLLALGVLLLAPPARSADVVNVTINIPAAVYDNPCLGEAVALHGDLHLLISVDTDSAGGYHYLSTWNASYAGTGLDSGVAYRASERKQESWTARELPASHTTTSVIQLVSKGGAPNAVLTTTVTTTIGADGVVTVTLDGTSVDCRG